MQQSFKASERRSRVSVFVERKPFTPFDLPSAQSRIRQINTTSDVWHIGEVQPVPINFNRVHSYSSPILSRIIHQLKFFIARELPRKSPETIASDFGSILKFVNSFDWQDHEDETVSDILAENLIFYIQVNRTFSDESGLNHLRYWYHRSYMMGLPDFSQDMAQALSTFRFRGHLKGADVLSSISGKGPLSSHELEFLKDSLREFEPLVEPSDGIYPGLICIWLYITLGIRASQAALLMQSDFAVHADPITGDIKYILNVPSVKKRYKIPRSYFKQRLLPHFLGKMMDKYLRYARTQVIPNRDSQNTPIFPIRSTRDRTSEVVGFDYLQTHSKNSIGVLIQQMLTKINAYRVAHEQQTIDFRITSRRLRKTFATRAAATGVPMVELAELLDHEDLQHVMVYYKLGLEFCEKLDQVIGEQFKDILSYFQGQIGLKGLIDKSLPQTVFGPDRLRQLVGIGLCAKGAPCDLTPPNACYVCPKFEACNDPNVHREVLESMQADISMQFGEDAPPGLTNAPHILACQQLIKQLGE